MSSSAVQDAAATRSARSSPSTKVRRSQPPVSEPSDSLCAGVAARVRDARTNAGLSQVDLAARAGLGKLTLSCWERGDKVPSVANLRRVAEALGCPMADLLDPHGQGARPVGAPVNLGENLRAIRVAAGMSEAELARHAGAASARTIERWENEEVEITISVLERLAKVMRVSVRQLVLGTAATSAPAVTPSAIIPVDRVPSFRKGIAARLRSQRIASGLSPEQFAERLGVPSSMVARWEVGRGFDLEGLAGCARVLEVSADYLLGLSEDYLLGLGEEVLGAERPVAPVEALGAAAD